MSVNAGEMYVNLGLKGDEGTVGKLNKTTDAFSELKSMSIETKATILAALVALEKVVSTSGELGTTLRNFQTLSGIAPQVLERYQYAAQKAGVANESLLNSFIKLQQTAFDIRAGKGLPDWLTPIITSLAQHGHDIGPDWAARWQKDPTLGFQAMQQYARETDIDVSTRAITLERTGLSADLVAALMRGALTPSKLSQVPTDAILTSSEIGHLDTMRQKWDSLWSVVSHTGAKMVSDVLESRDERRRNQIEYYKERGIVINQNINVHGNGDAQRLKKAAHDGTMDAGRQISQTVSGSGTNN